MLKVLFPVGLLLFCCLNYLFSSIKLNKWKYYKYNLCLNCIRHFVNDHDQIDEYRNFICIYRPKSKHTSLFLPLNKWEIPSMELLHLYGALGGDYSKLNLGEYIGVNFTATSYNKHDLLHRLSVTRSNFFILQKAVSISIMSYGLYEVFNEGNLKYVEFNHSYVFHPTLSGSKSDDNNDNHPFPNFELGG